MPVHALGRGGAGELRERAVRHGARACDDLASSRKQRQVELRPVVPELKLLGERGRTGAGRQEMLGYVRYEGRLRPGIVRLPQLMEDPAAQAHEDGKQRDASQHRKVNAKIEPPHQPGPFAKT